MKESIKFSEFEGARQNTLDTNKESYSERNLINRSEKMSVNTKIKRNTNRECEYGDKWQFKY